MDFKKTNIAQLMKFILLILLTFYGISANCQSAQHSQPAYSDFVKSNGLLFVSGQIAPQEIGGAGSSFSDEAESALKKIVQILRVNNLSASDVVSCSVYMTDIKQFGEFNTIYRKYFKSPYPSRTLVGVQQLVQEARIEISVIASLKKIK